MRGVVVVVVVAGGSVFERARSHFEMRIRIPHEDRGAREGGGGGDELRALSAPLL